MTLESMDSVAQEGGSSPSWTFGGGTSLAIDLGHRVSYDIDAFVDSARLIQSLVPVRNAVTRAICWNDETGRADYQYPGHYLKLIVRGVGEIDFLGAYPLLDDAVVPFDFEGRTISRERPAEVIAKKIYHRGSSFKARDVFDLAGTYLALQDELSEITSSPFVTAEVFGRVRYRIEMRRAAFEEEIFEEVNPTEFGESYLGDACDLALEALDFMENGPRPAC